MRELWLAVSGSRYPLPRAQLEAAVGLMRALVPTTLHHGACTGADELLALAAAELDPRPTIVAHPALDVPWWFCSEKAPEDFVQPPLPPLERNREMVRAAHALIACPSESDPRARSGTWATIRAAIKEVEGGGRCRMVAIFLPSGQLMRRGALPPELRP